MMTPGPFPVTPVNDGPPTTGIAPYATLGELYHALAAQKGSFDTWPAPLRRCHRAVGRGIPQSRTNAPRKSDQHRNGGSRAQPNSRRLGGLGLRAVPTRYRYRIADNHDGGHHQCEFAVISVVLPPPRPEGVEKTQRRVTIEKINRGRVYYQKAQLKRRDFFSKKENHVALPDEDYDPEASADPDMSLE
ncbi:hypothetical protein ILUMI_09370 [Ignelater luminosus]|uniref:Uncharacterized protein n=1 Tax=Ignelater luminosus TaxID=2038154 RepID=A0A8K0GCH6_IGNLU|nr:hypothetical protein ILUMI_09370 [Ignelater luminosus]